MNREDGHDNADKSMDFFFYDKASNEGNEKEKN